MYKVEYKRACDISNQYTIIGTPSQHNFIYECILIQGKEPTAITLETNILSAVNVKEPLKDLIRCYIINETDLPDSVTLQKLIDRYR